MKNLNYLLVFTIFLNFTNLLAKDIPVIVISPGKTLQSKGTVGSDVEVVDKNIISNSSELFIGDILDNNLVILGMLGFENKYDALAVVYQITDQIYKEGL